MQKPVQKQCADCGVLLAKIIKEPEPGRPIYCAGCMGMRMLQLNDDDLEACMEQLVEGMIEKMEKDKQGGKRKPNHSQDVEASESGHRMMMAALQ